MHTRGCRGCWDWQSLYAPDTKMAIMVKLNFLLHSLEVVKNPAVKRLYMKKKKKKRLYMRKLVLLSLHSNDNPYYFRTEDGSHGMEWSFTSLWGLQDYPAPSNLSLLFWLHRSVASLKIVWISLTWKNYP